MKVMMSDPALDDVEALEIYLAEKSPAKAKKITREIFTRGRALATFPRRGRKIPELGDDNLRELIVGDYRVMYEIDDDAGVVEILAVFHGKRDFPLDRFLDD
jgi:toxin ParE1/3/4